MCWSWTVTRTYGSSSAGRSKTGPHVASAGERRAARDAIARRQAALAAQDMRLPLVDGDGVAAAPRGED